MPSSSIAASQKRGGEKRIDGETAKAALSRRERGAGIIADALDHGAEAVRALRRQVLAKSKILEHRNRVGRQDFASVLAGAQCEQHCDQPAHDMGVAVADE